MPKKRRKMTSFEKLILTIVRANPNRLLQHAHGCPLHKIEASDIVDVCVTSVSEGYYRINFTFDEKSKAINDILDEGDIVRYDGISISDAISNAHVPCSFMSIRKNEYLKYCSDSPAGYICYLAKCFLGIDATSLEEVKLNLVLMGMMSGNVSEDS